MRGVFIGGQFVVELIPTPSVRPGSQNTPGDQIFAKFNERPRGDNARERLGDSKCAHVRINRAVEGHIFCQRVDEHQRVADVSLDQRIFGLGLSEPQTSFSPLVEAAGEE